MITDHFYLAREVKFAVPAGGRARDACARRPMTSGAPEFPRPGEAVWPSI